MEMNELDKQDIRNAVAYLDAFSKTFCRFSYDYNRFDVRNVLFKTRTKNVL